MEKRSLAILETAWVGFSPVLALSARSWIGAPKTAGNQYNSGNSAANFDAQDDPIV
jgi:hypothetical protein